MLERLAHGKMFQCNYCPIQFNGTGTRCYAHLTGVQGGGVAKCLGVPEATVQLLRAAKAAKEANSSKKRKGAEAAAEAAVQRQQRQRLSDWSSASGAGPGSSAGRTSSAAGNSQVRSQLQSVE